MSPAPFFFFLNLLLMMVRSGEVRFLLVQLDASEDIAVDSPKVQDRNTYLYPRKDLSPSQCEWSEWSIGECSETCGNATRKETRVKIPKDGIDGECIQDDIDTIYPNCKFIPCPVNCVWGDWKEGTCSKSCGPGIRVDTRKKVQVEEHGGTCEGKTSRQKNCIVKAQCPKTGVQCCRENGVPPSCIGMCRTSVVFAQIPAKKFDDYPCYKYEKTIDDCNSGSDKVPTTTTPPHHFTNYANGTTATTTTAKTADLDYFCATEGQICNCDGKVKYGRDETWTAERDVKGSINCTNDVFGDPKLFLQKECRCTPTGDWILVEKKKECSDSHRFSSGHIGRVGEVSQCAEKCRAISTMFIFGTNEFGFEDQYGKRCDGRGCDCYCETEATSDGNCEMEDHEGYNLYKFVNLVDQGCQGGDVCCTPEKRCGLGEGDCDEDDDCEVGLKCGKDNCVNMGQAMVGTEFEWKSNGNPSPHPNFEWDSTDDCCY